MKLAWNRRKCPYCGDIVHLMESYCHSIICRKKHPVKAFLKQKIVWPIEVGIRKAHRKLFHKKPQTPFIYTLDHQKVADEPVTDSIIQSLRNFKNFRCSASNSYLQKYLPFEDAEELLEILKSGRLMIVK